LKSGKEGMETARALIDRFMRLAGFKTRREVARALKLSESDLSERLRANLLNNLVFRLVKYGLATGISLDLIFRPKTIDFKLRQDLVMSRLGAIKARLPSREFEELFHLTGMLWEILIVGGRLEREKYYRICKAIIEGLYKERNLEVSRKRERERERERENKGGMI